MVDEESEMKYKVRDKVKRYGENHRDTDRKLVFIFRVHSFTRHTSRIAEQKKELTSMYITEENKQCFPLEQSICIITPWKMSNIIYSATAR